MIDERYKIQAEIIKALAHPSRLFIVNVLAEREHCVCELTEMIGADISTVSKHLTVLKSAGLITDEKRGTQVFYSLCCPCILKFISCISDVSRRSAEKSLKGI